MTTTAELKKHAKDIGFVEKMEMLGFKLGPDSFWFYRKRDGFIDYISFWVKSSGVFMGVPVICLKEELVKHCDMNKFPKGFNVDIPFYSSTYLNEECGVEIGHDPWRIKTPQEIKESLDELYQLVVSSAVPWFKHINSNEKLWESFTLNFREKTSTSEVINLREKLLGKGSA